MRQYSTLLEISRVDYSEIILQLEGSFINKVGTGGIINVKKDLLADFIDILKFYLKKII